MKKNIKIDLHNEFDIIVRDSITGQVKQSVKGYNVILNQFWGLFLSNTSNADVTGYIYFGSGTTEPLATDTALTSYLGKKTATLVSRDRSTLHTDGVVKTKKTIRLNAGEYTGASISEVGFGNSSTLATKSLLKDSNGNPLVITVGALDVIDIFGTFYSKLPVTDEVHYCAKTGGGLVGFATFSSWTSLGIGAVYFKNIATKNGLEDGDSKYSAGTASVSASIPDKKQTITIPNVAAANGNVGGFSGILLGDTRFKIPTANFSQPTIVKEVIGTGDGLTVDFSSVFGRIKNNGTAKLYVNDVEAAATFDYLIPKGEASDCACFLMRVIENYDKLYWDGSNNTLSFPASLSDGIICENVHYQTVGITGLLMTYFVVYASQDLVNWVSVSSTVSAAYQKYRYWKLVPNHANAPRIDTRTFKSTQLLNFKDVHATVAPPAGAVVSLTYQPDIIAKDSAHIVNNVKIEIVYNEYTP